MTKSCVHTSKTVQSSNVTRVLCFYTRTCISNYFHDNVWCVFIFCSIL